MSERRWGLLIHVEISPSVLGDQRYLEIVADKVLLDIVISWLSRGTSVVDTCNPNIPEGIWRGVLNPLYESYGFKTSKINKKVNQVDMFKVVQILPLDENS